MSLYLHIIYRGVESLAKLRVYREIGRWLWAAANYPEKSKMLRDTSGRLSQASPTS